MDRAQLAHGDRNKVISSSGKSKTVHIRCRSRLRLAANTSLQNDYDRFFRITDKYSAGATAYTAMDRSRLDDVG